jgi:hypothetical protein
MSAPVAGPAVYSDWSRDRAGWFLGLSGPQLSVMVLAGLPLLLGLGAQKWWLVALWLPVYAAVALLVLLPVRGRPAFRWLGDLALFVFGGVMGFTRWSSRGAEGAVDDLSAPDLPGVLAGIAAHDGPPFGAASTRVVIIQDKAARTWAVTARVDHPGIAFAEPEDRARMAGGLTQMLEMAARTELVEVIALQIRTVPDDGAERADWQARHLRADAPAQAMAVTRTLNQLVTTTGVRREAFVTVVVPEARIRRLAADSGGGIDGRARVLHGVMRDIESQLRGPVGCADVRWLDAAGLGEAVRTGFAPGDAAPIAAAALEDPAARQPMAAAGPSGAVADARHYRHDAWASVACTILLPDEGALLGALSQVFVPAAEGERRSVTVFFEPLSRAAGDQAVRRAENSAMVGNELAARAGFRPRARRRRATEHVAGQDAKLAGGRSLVRAAVAAAVTVPAELSVADAGRRLESSIRARGFTPLRLDLAQDSGFVAACIPLGVGLPRRRGIRR